MTERNKWLMTPESAADWFEEVYPPREDVERVCAEMIKAERERVLAEVARFEGRLSHHHDAHAAREYNITELRALLAKLRSEP
jgi:hypothetical protein